ncbi:hypothetical protein Q8W71_06790 [Methylobacterium sp. NEAU 140]|uniref:hypothetical protein n=1 Tax=Methylobacterium sp. NEAU 140 TaxID=3064945 RepID=UPI002733759D|nr:hypothetical protein [Methylobacterium sp. NEAU 140]MDP4022323.1 hypothetical protein [Methylobacterium sp. NEAU 140]
MGTIPVSADKLIQYYARRDKQDSTWPDVQAVMKGIPGTPCCVQISRAFCGAGLAVPAKSWRRSTAAFPGGRGWRALLATDEVEEFLAVPYGDGENLQGPKTKPADVKGAIGGIPGVLIFRHGLRRGFPPKGKFEHTEIWDGSQIVQRDMAEGYLFSCPRVLFWPTDESGAADFEV